MSLLAPTGSTTSRVLDDLPSILANAGGHTEIWGINLKQAERRLLDIILEKVLLVVPILRLGTLLVLIYQQFLSPHAAIPALQDARTRSSLAKTLEWRRYSTPRKLVEDAESILPKLGLCYITLVAQGQHVLWVNIDEMVIKGYSPIYQSLATTQGIKNLGLGVMEKLANLLLLHWPETRDTNRYSAACVIEFKTRAVAGTRVEQQHLQSKLRSALEDLATIIRSHYPGVLQKTYIISPCEEYLASLDIPESLWKDTLLLPDARYLHCFLGSQVPPEYGGTGKPLVESDLLRSSSLDNNAARDLDSEMQGRTASPDIEGPEAGMANPAFTTNIAITMPITLGSGERGARLICSDFLGIPPFVLNPIDLQRARDICPSKSGSRLALVDSNLVVKYGHDVRLAEAEALYLVYARTTIAAPKIHAAYILDGVGYIDMSYEEGEPLEHYWDRVSEWDQDRVLEQLRDYVDQMRKIRGDFIGGFDRSPCRDGIFEASYGGHKRYSYGPFESEESFNEGVIQALRDRLPPKVRESEHNMESNFFNSEYFLYQAIRELKDHDIVFTHADLHPGNIIVRADGTPVLLGWGLAGLWPDYWEFYRAMHHKPWRASWDRMVEQFIPPSYVEQSVLKRVFATAWN